MRGTQLQTYAIEGTRLDGAMYSIELLVDHPPGDQSLDGRAPRDQSRVTGGETYTTCFSWSRAGHCRSGGAAGVGARGTTGVARPRASRCGLNLTTRRAVGGQGGG